MSEFSVNCGIHGEVFKVGGECSVCILVERNKLLAELGHIEGVIESLNRGINECRDRYEKAEDKLDRQQKVLDAAIKFTLSEGFSAGMARGNLETAVTEYQKNKGGCDV